MTEKITESLVKFSNDLLFDLAEKEIEIKTLKDEHSIDLKTLLMMIENNGISSFHIAVKSGKTEVSVPERYCLESEVLKLIRSMKSFLKDKIDAK